jgi:hypothetical protein
MDPDSKEQQKTKNSAADGFTPGSDIRTYIENRIELLSITVSEEIAKVASESIQKFVGLLFLSFGAVFLWIALGFFLGELLDSQSLGFFLAALPLLLFGTILYRRSSRSLAEKIQYDIIKRFAISFDKKKKALRSADDGSKQLNSGDKT